MNGKNCHHSPRATLAAVGLKLQALQLLAPIREKVKIAQKKFKEEIRGTTNGYAAGKPGT